MYLVYQPIAQIINNALKKVTILLPLSFSVLPLSVTNLFFPVFHSIYKLFCHSRHVFYIAIYHFKIVGG